MRYVGPETLIEDALQILETVSIVITVGSTVEKRCWGQLFRVADNNHLLAAGDCADGVPDGDLRGLIEDDNINWSRVSRQVLRHRQRTHHQAGSQLCQRRRH